MRRPLVLYSTNTWLAYRINEKYYRGQHYAWCASLFSFKGLPHYDYDIPPTSSPAEIYHSLASEVRRGTGTVHELQRTKWGFFAVPGRRSERV